MSDKPLLGLTVLVTRPQQQAEYLSTLLTAVGANPILFPTLEIVDIADKRPLLTTMKNLINYDLAIFVSANAVNKTIPYWPKLNFSLPVVAIGEATARELAKLGIVAIVPVAKQFTSEGLLTLPELADVRNKRIVIFSGVGGRDILEKTLVKRGAVVTKVETYRRQCPQVDIMPELIKWQQQQLNIIVSTSNESLQNLYDLTDQQTRMWLLTRQLLVVSERMATFARSLNFMHNPIVAANASDEAILQALLAWYTRS